MKISIEPNKRHLEIDLQKYNWIPKDFEKIGGLLMTEDGPIVTLKKKLILKLRNEPLLT